MILCDWESSKTPTTKQKICKGSQTIYFIICLRVHRRDLERGKVHECVAQYLSYGTANVARVIAHWNRHSDPTFEAGFKTARRL